MKREISKYQHYSRQNKCFNGNAVKIIYTVYYSIYYNYNIYYARLMLNYILLLIYIKHKMVTLYNKVH